MTPKRILVIQVSRIGDTLLATPAIRSLAEAWPTARIDVLAHPKRFEILKQLPFIGRVTSISKKTAPFRGWFGLLHKPYDVALVYGYDQALVSYALRITKQVTAFTQNNPQLNAKISIQVTPPPFQSGHAVNQLMLLPQAIGVQPHTLRLAYQVTDNEQEWAIESLTNEITAHSAPLIGLQIASFPTKSYRDWPIESFMELCKRILSVWPQSHFLIFGGPAEHQRTTALKNALGSSSTLYAGKLTLRETGALMSQLNLYIGVDTGPTHLMSTFNIPMVVMYHGFSRSELIAPLEHPALYAIDHPLAGPNCPTDVHMSDISVNTVFASVERALREHPPTNQ